MAVRSLSSLKGYDSKTIILIGTALSTQGTLNFQNNLLSAEPDAVLDLLEEKNEIPDFASITVVSQQMEMWHLHSRNFLKLRKNACRKSGLVS